jgi:hypothetical protein
MTGFCKYGGEPSGYLTVLSSYQLLNPAPFYVVTLLKHHAMKTYGGKGGKVPLILNVGMEWR